jgi:hypothetical protein
LAISAPVGVCTDHGAVSSASKKAEPLRRIPLRIYRLSDTAVLFQALGEGWWEARDADATSARSGSAR